MTQEKSIESLLPVLFVNGATKYCKVIDFWISNGIPSNNLSVQFPIDIKFRIKDAGSSRFPRNQPTFNTPVSIEWIYDALKHLKNMVEMVNIMESYSSVTNRLREYKKMGGMCKMNLFSVSTLCKIIQHTYFATNALVNTTLNENIK